MLVSACAPQPPIPATPTPETVTFVTIVPIPTLLPTVTVNAPTQGVPTVTTVPTVAVPATARPQSQAQARVRAPELLSPKAPTLFKDGNDIKFTYASIGKLAANQCYQLHVEMAVPGLPKGNRGDDFVDVDNCGDTGPAGKDLSFVLYRGKFTNSPNYGTMLAQTLALAPEAKRLKLTWQVRVVQNNGRAADGVHYNTAPLSPYSPVVELEFEP